MQTDLFDLKGRVVLVAGGAGYLGRVTCRELCRRGATVIVSDVNGTAATEAADELSNAGHRAEPMALDIQDEPAIEKAMDEIVVRHGHLDSVVNMTAWSTGKPFREMSLEDWNRGTNVTLSGAFVLTRAAARVMEPRGSGSIIHFSSMYGIVSPRPSNYPEGTAVNPPDYGAAKAGILQLVRYTASLFGRSGIRCNAVAPGPFPNPSGHGSDSEFISRLAESTPLGRVGRAEEIAGSVVYLVSDASSYTTGIVITVDGGWAAW